MDNKVIYIAAQDLGLFKCNNSTKCDKIDLD
jgi:hypothetical protein